MPNHVIPDISPVFLLNLLSIPYSFIRFQNSRGPPRVPSRGFLVLICERLELILTRTVGSLDRCERRAALHVIRPDVFAGLLVFVGTADGFRTAKFKFGFEGMLGVWELC